MNDFIRLDKTHLKNILEKGFSNVEVSKGHWVRITEDDLLFDKEEVQKFVNTEKPNATHNKDGRINFGMYFIDKINGWGFEVIDTIEKTTLLRKPGFKSLEEAREAGFQEAKRIIDEIEKGNKE